MAHMKHIWQTYNIFPNGSQRGTFKIFKKIAKFSKKFKISKLFKKNVKILIFLKILNGKYPPEEGQETRLPESTCDIVNLLFRIYL